MVLIDATPPSVDEAPTGHSLEVWVSCEFGLTSEEIRVDESSCARLRDQSWILCRLSAKPSVWDQIKTASDVYVAGKCRGDSSYEVAVHGSAIPWLRSNHSDLDLQYDPTKPVAGDVCIHGIWEATRRAEARFLENAAKAIRSGRGRGLELCYRKIAESRHLDLLLEWAILNHDLQQSNAHVLRKLGQHLVFLGLNLLEDYDTPAAIELLGKSHDEILFGAFRRYHRSLCKGNITNDELRQVISLVRCLLETVGGRKDFRQHRVFQWKDGVHAKICGYFVGITSSNPFGKFNPEKILNALARSEFFDDEDIRTLDVVVWSKNLMTILPIGKRDKYIHLPASVLNELSSAQVETLRHAFAQFFHQHPSLWTLENNVLVLLAYSATINADIAKVLSDWMASSDGSSFYRVLVEEHQEPRTVHELAFSLVTLLAYKQLLPSAPKEPTATTGRPSLADFDALMHGSTLINEREVIERMISSFVRVLGISDFTDEHQQVIQFLVTVLDTDPYLNPRDGISGQYLVQRMHGLSHEDAFDIARHYQFSTTIGPGPEMTSPQPIACQDTLLEAAQDYLTVSHNFDYIKLVCRFIPSLDSITAATWLSRRPQSWLDQFLIHLCRHEVVERPARNSQLSTAKAIVAIIRRKPLAPAPLWDGTWIFSASLTDIDTVAAKLDREIHSTICTFTFLEWSAGCCGYENVLLSNFFDTVFKFRNDLARCMTADSLFLLQNALPSQQSLQYWIVSTARTSDTLSYPSEALLCFLDPIRQQFEKQPSGLFPLVHRLSILETRFKLKVVHATDVNWSNPLSNDFSFWESVQTVSSEDLARSNAKFVGDMYSKLSPADLLEKSEYMRNVGRQWADFSDDILACLNADEMSRYYFLDLAKHSIQLLNIHTASVVGSALKRWGFDPSKPCKVWDTINPDDNFAGCRKFMHRRPCLPYIFPYIRELQRSNNATDDLIKAMQYIGYLGTKREGESRQDELGHKVQVVREGVIVDKPSPSYSSHCPSSLSINQLKRKVEPHLNRVDPLQSASNAKRIKIHDNKIFSEDLNTQHQPQINNSNTITSNSSIRQDAINDNKIPGQNPLEIWEPCTQASVGFRDKPFVEKDSLSNSLSANTSLQVQYSKEMALKALRNYQVFKEASQQMEMMLPGIVDAAVTALEILSSMEYTQTVLLSCATTVSGQDLFAPANGLKSRRWTAAEQDKFALKFSSFVPGIWSAREIVEEWEELVKVLFDKIQLLNEKSNSKRGATA